MQTRGRWFGLRLLVTMILGLSVLAAPAAAGGWATVELDEPLSRVPVGEPVAIGFRVLQHGETPFEGAEPYLMGTHRQSGEEVRADGRAEGEPGHYVVEVTFPRSGEWKWRIHPEPFPDPTSFPTLTALDPGQLALEPDLPAVPEEEVVHPADVVRGGCGLDPALAYTLTDVTPRDRAETDAEAPVVKESESELPVALTELTGDAHAIAVRTGADPTAGVVACGGILGEPVDGELIVGLSEANGSGYVGFARLVEDGGRTTVTIYLARDLATANTPLGVPITIDDQGFSPSRLEIKAGTTVTWTNAGAIDHTVTADDLDFDDSGLLHPGDSFSQTFDTPGTYVYRCGPHAFMVGTVVVS